MTRIIRKSENQKKTGLVDRTMRDMEAKGEFPKRFLINPSGRAVGWLEDEVDAWIAQRAASRAAAA